MIIIFLTILILAGYAGLLIYYRHGWLEIPQNDKNSLTTNNVHTVISVIIAARNEEKNIYDCLQSMVSQIYPKQLFEVIVVDDYSTDATPEIVQLFSHKNVSMLSLKDFTENKNLNSYKKKAIEIAISKATGDLIVTTDADCIAPVNWLRTMAAFYEKQNPAFIAAPVDYSLLPIKGNNLWMRFFASFQSLDFMGLQGITGAAVHKKFHFMCNGANLAYEKKVFYEVGGYKEIDMIASGDDMLLMHKIYKKYPDRILFLKSADSIIKTKPVEKLMDFFHQRIRWASKAGEYTDKKIIAVLIFVYVFNVWMLVLGVLSVFHPFIFLWFLGFLSGKIFFELFFIYPVAKFFNKEDMLWWFPVAQPLHIVYTIIAGWLGKFGSYRWKKRKVK
jgi:cellulose synthase/poly-beta-1,6-N-acetylglucosamine synthase-like glycosyltransferase